MSAKLKQLIAYPWLTEEAVEFLTTWCRENPYATVVEYGAGSSTLWFAAQGKSLRVTTIEHDGQWARHTQAQAAARKLRTNVLLSPRPYHVVPVRELAARKLRACASIHLALIDGRDRCLCAQAVRPHIPPSGIVMLDNAERGRYKAIHKLFADWPKREAVQEVPRMIDGFHYPGWSTCWWTRPEEGR